VRAEARRLAGLVDAARQKSCSKRNADASSPTGLPRSSSHVAGGLRRRHAVELEVAFLDCIRRERARAGLAGAAYAWVRMVADTVATAVAVRLDERRSRRIAALRTRGMPEGDTMMTSLWQDVRYAWRGMRRTPVFSTVVIVTLGLAIGANAAIFGVVNAVLLRSLPYPEQERLVVIYQAIPKAIAHPIGFSAPDYLAFEQRATSFESMETFRNREYELSRDRTAGARQRGARLGVAL
jgi:hypothetical protein